jgi:hypothetical protein
VCTFRIPRLSTAPKTTTATSLEENITNTNETNNTNDTNDITMESEENGMVECGKRFAHKHVLERHVLTHTKPPKVFSYFLNIFLLILLN